MRPIRSLPLASRSATKLRATRRAPSIRVSLSSRRAVAIDDEVSITSTMSMPSAGLDGFDRRCLGAGGGDDDQRQGEHSQDAEIWQCAHASAGTARQGRGSVELGEEIARARQPRLAAEQPDQRHQEDEQGEQGGIVESHDDSPSDQIASASCRYPLSRSGVGCSPPYWTRSQASSNRVTRRTITPGAPAAARAGPISEAVSAEAGSAQSSPRRARTAPASRRHCSVMSSESSISNEARSTTVAATSSDRDTSRGRR